jgi:hypothetical protein
MTVSWDYSLNVEPNHERAAKALIDKLRDLGGDRVITMQSSVDRGGYIFVAEGVR